MITHIKKFVFSFNKYYKCISRLFSCRIFLTISCFTLLCCIVFWVFLSIYDQHDEHETHQTNSLKKVYHCWVFDLVILVPSLSLSRIYSICRHGVSSHSLLNFKYTDIFASHILANNKDSRTDIKVHSTGTLVFKIDLATGRRYGAL